MAGLSGIDTNLYTPKIDSHSSAISNFKLVEQHDLANLSGQSARSSLKLSDIRTYYSHVNGYFNLAFSGIMGTWMGNNGKEKITYIEEIGKLQKQFEAMELDILMGVVSNSVKNRVILYKVAELIQRYITNALQQLNFFFRVDLKEKRGFKFLNDLANIGINKTSKLTNETKDRRI